MARKCLSRICSVLAAVLGMLVASTFLFSGCGESPREQSSKAVAEKSSGEAAAGDDASPDSRVDGVTAAEGPTVPGPEVNNLLERISGYILHTPAGDGRSIVAVSLPELKETAVRPFGEPGEDDDPTIHALSGPDDEGRIAYVEDHYFVKNKADRRHLLKIIQIDGTGNIALFSRPGDAMWATSAARKGEIGRHLSLSPTGGKVALLSGLSNKQMPQALFHQGVIEIWDVRKKERLRLETGGVDAPMSWFPDGNRLAFVRFVKRKDVPNSGVTVEEFGRGHYTGSWKELPAIYILDVPTGETRFLSLGWTPMVSADEKTVFVGGWVPDPAEGVKLIWKSVDLATGTAADVTWPGDAGGLVANPTDDLVLYWGLPTTGAKIERSPYGSFRRGTMLLTIKATNLNSDRFQTVIPAIDPRDPISFGIVKQR
jgi:hypothetical protein